MAAPFVWDPDRVLHITDLGRNEIICIGRAATRFNSRCAWTIEEPARSEAASLLRSMAQKPPTHVRQEELIDLATLCLCHQAHRHQLADALMELQSRLPYACDDYERFKTVQAENTQLHLEVLNGTNSTHSAQLKVQMVEMEKKILQNRETSLCRKVDEQAIAVSKLQETERGLTAQLAIMSQQLDSQSTTIAELQESESGLRRTSDHLEQLLQKEKLTVAGLEKANADLEGQQTELSRQLYNQKGVVDELEASKSNLQGQLHELRQQLNKQNAAVGDLEDDNRTLKDQHTTAVAEVGTSQLKLEQMESELQSIQISKAELQRQLNAALVLINLKWQTRLRNWVRACHLSITEAFTRVGHGLATPLAKVKRFLPIIRGLFRSTKPVSGQCAEAKEEVHPLC